MVGQNCEVCFVAGAWRVVVVSCCWLGWLGCESSGMIGSLSINNNDVQAGGATRVEEDGMGPVTAAGTFLVP